VSIQVDIHLRNGEVLRNDLEDFFFYSSEAMSTNRTSWVLRWRELFKRIAKKPEDQRPSWYRKFTRIDIIGYPSLKFLREEVIEMW
jgi:DNA/RNA-binding domain of Phe-tRNA-synthetase-like protein